MLRRSAFLEGTHFDFIPLAIVQRLAAVSAPHSASYLYVMDAGWGTGHHLATIIERLSGRMALPCSGLGIDLSKEAVRFASRRLQHLAFAVTDIWTDWPVRSASVDVLISIFASKNFQEMARVLRPAGLLAVIYPGPNHLVELRRLFELLRISTEKPRLYLDAAQSWFAEARIQHCGRRTALNRDQVMDLVRRFQSSAPIGQAGRSIL